MSNWFKKKLQQLSDHLNADEAHAFEQEQGDEKSEQAGNAGASQPSNKALDNIEELKEVAIGAITRGIKMMGYGSNTVSGFVFHSRFAGNAIENVAVNALAKDADFIRQIKRTLRSRNISYREDLAIETVSQSALTDQVTPIMDGVGVEVLIPGQSLRRIRARVVATEGITWEPEYILEPTGKTYFIGRCKDPKIDNGPKIHNDIAFVGREEKDEEQYQINNYISRAHAQIVFDKDLGAFTIYRSKFLNNPSHKIKIYNAGRNDFSGVSLNQSTVPHVLKDGDSICFNDKIVLEFFITA